MIKERDRFLDPWLTVRSDRLRGFVSEALAMISHIEAYYGKRARRRRQDDLETHQALVETLIANLAYAVVDRSGPRTIAVSLSKATKPTRYDRPIFRQLPQVIEILRAHDVLRFRKSRSLGYRSTIEATPLLIGRIAASVIGFEDFGRHEFEEVIILARTTRGFTPSTGDGTLTFGKQREWINFAVDTEESARFREEVRTINAHLAEAKLEFSNGELVPLIIDTNRRRLRRYFSLSQEDSSDTPRFDLGGRLFGGWWQNIARAERHRIRIGREEIVDLDYAGMFPRLAYLKSGR
jgi:hypothetical protein